MRCYLSIRVLPTSADSNLAVVDLPTCPLSFVICSMSSFGLYSVTLKILLATFMSPLAASPDFLSGRNGTGCLVSVWAAASHTPYSSSIVAN